MKTIESVVAVEPSFLAVRMDDGARGVFDISPYLSLPVFVPLHDFENLKRVRNGGYFVEWDCGADLSADSIAAGLR